jgi:hypothetical protein
MAYWTWTVEEFKNDAIRNGKYRYHFMMDGQDVNVFSDLHDNANEWYETRINNYNSGEYWFSRPIRLPDSLTLSMGAPFEKAELVQQTTLMRVDYFDGNGSPYVNFYWDDVATRPAPFEFQISSGEVVEISGYRTDTPEVDAVDIAAINGTPQTAHSTGGDIDGTFRYGIVLRDFATSSSSNSPPTYVQVKIKRYRQVIPLTLFYDANDVEE